MPRILKANPFRKVEDMTTDNVGATVIDLQVHSARRRARFEDAMKRHPSYLSRLAAAGDDSAEIAFHVCQLTDSAAPEAISAHTATVAVTPR